MKEALELLGKVTGWGNIVRPIIGYDEVRTFTAPDETIGTGHFVFLCGVSICGEASGAVKARGQGATLTAAILDCAHKVVEYHDEMAKWHRERAKAASEAMIASALGGR